MTGTPNQIELAEQIRTRTNAEFDRVSEAFGNVAQMQTGQDRLDTLAIIQILEEKRTEVMAINAAGYFIRTWGDSDNQVRQMIGQDARYRVIQAGRKMRRAEGSGSSV